MRAAPYAMGLTKPTPAVASPAAIAAVSASAASLPASVDLTPYAIAVGNQGDVGSCAAWATDYGALGYWENKQRIAGGGLEPMYTYAQVDGGADNGSSIEGNLAIDEQQGIDTRSDYWQGDFDYKDVPTAAERTAAVNWKLSGYADLTVAPGASSTVTQLSIESALAGGDPVVIGIPVYSDFFAVSSANSGLYSGPASGTVLEGYHAIVALGYSAGGLRIENSWGTGWGAGGYATLAWSFVNRYVFDAVSVGPLVTGQPVAGAAPAVSGIANQGQTLTASSGTWSPAATSYSYQWQLAGAGTSDWTPISGATGATYVLSSASVGDTVRVVVTANDKTGPGTSASAPVGPITALPYNTVAPTIGGTPTEGQMLTATAGTWNPAATSYAYQWQRSTNAGTTWTAIAQATGTTYVPGPSDVNAKLRIQVTATNGKGSTVAYAIVGPIASGAPANTIVPAVSGTLRQGQVLTASTGTWSPAGTTYTEQWQRATATATSWTPITGASGATYTPVAADVAAQLRVVVTATNSYGQQVADSAATGPIAPLPPAVLTAPAISGAATRGVTLSVTTGTWSPAATSYTYAWQRSTNAGVSWSAISGASTASYTLALADEKAQVRAVVTALNSSGQTSANTAAVGPVSASPPVNTTAPALTGTAKVGSVLSASAGAWSGSGNAYTYQWQHNPGTGFVNITGATKSTYTVASTDRGDTLRVVVTATNPDAALAAPSTATATVPSS